MVKYVFITVVNVLFIVGALNLMGFRVNITESYPEGVYRLVSKDWKKRDLVEVCLPDPIKNIAVDRGYLRKEGRCGGYPPVIKKVAGIEGDYVEISQIVSINGMALENTIVKTTDDQGRELAKAESGAVEKDHVWLISTFSDISYDSRYFGAISEEYVIGKLEPLWIF